MSRYAFPAFFLLWTYACGAPGDDAQSASIHFTDVTQESGLHAHQISGVDPPTMLLESISTGIALIDFDQDGDCDVFVPNGATIAQPNLGPGCSLFENLGDLRFRDVSAQAGIDLTRWCYGATVGDYDNDGFDDIFVTCLGENALLRNTGKGAFEEVGHAAGLRGAVWSTGSSFGDIDNDGDLDLYVCNYCVLDPSAPPPYSSFVGVRVLAGPMGLPDLDDQLYLNQGDGTFRDISEESGILAQPASWGLGAVILDFDGDHLPDIYVGNDSRACFLFRNLGGARFEEVGVFSGIAFSEEGEGQATMGIAVGDVDGNGLPDVFTTNFMFDTNTLHLNLGDLLFEDRTMAYGLHLDSRPYLSWATGFFDFDHDSDEDLIFFNGNIYPQDVCQARDWGYNQPPVLYAREADQFRRLDASSAGAWLDDERCDRGTGFGDLDGDGDVDMVVSGRNQAVRVLRNDRDGGAWLIVRLEDPRPGHEHSGIGAKIKLSAGSAVQHRWIASGVSFFASSAPVAHFGLPAGTREVALEVSWPDGHLQTMERVKVPADLVVQRD